MISSIQIRDIKNADSYFGADKLKFSFSYFFTKY